MTNEPNRELFVPKTGAIRYSTLAEAVALPASFSIKKVRNPSTGATSWSASLMIAVSVSVQ